MDYKKSWAILVGGLWIGGILAAIGFLAKIDPALWAGIVIMAVALTQGDLFYRCPHCKKRMNFRMKRPEHCPECGGKLD